MIANLIEASIATVTGASPDTFTLADVSGSPNFNDVFGSSGNRKVRYCAIQYTDANRSEIAQAQWGVGTIDLSTLILTQTFIQGTWLASGPTYDDTSPAELTFTASALSTRLFCTPLAMDCNPWALPGYSTYGDDIGVPPCNGGSTTGTWPVTTLSSSGSIYYFPIVLNFMFPVGSVNFRVTTARASGTNTQVHFAIYELGPDGLPGKRLVSVSDTSNNVMATTGNKNLAFTPVFLPPGMYVCAFRIIFSDGSSTPAIQAMVGVGPSPFGVDHDNANTKILYRLSKASATLDDPADVASLVASASSEGIGPPFITFEVS